MREYDDRLPEKVSHLGYADPERHPLDLSAAQAAAPVIESCGAQSLLRIIAGKCADCAGDQWLEVQLCPVFHCPNWCWRFGCDSAVVQSQSPQWLDPAQVAIAGHKQCLRECGYESWHNPLTNQQEGLQERIVRFVPGDPTEGGNG
jgi:hypothetical protein